MVGRQILAEEIERGSRGAGGQVWRRALARPLWTGGRKLLRIGRLLAWKFGWTVRGPARRERRAAIIGEELRWLGPVSRGQRNWWAPTSRHPGTRGGAALLCLLPLDWRKRQFTLTWSGNADRLGDHAPQCGGLALGECLFTTGFARWIGDSTTAWLPVLDGTRVPVVVAGLAIALSESMSNTAPANMIVPVAIPVAQAAGADPLQPALAATLGAAWAS